MGTQPLQSQPAVLQPHQPQHSQPVVLQPHQSQLASSQAQPLTPQQIAYLQLQQMTTSMAAPGVPVFGQSPPGIFTQPRVAGHPFYQVSAVVEFVR